MGSAEQATIADANGNVTNYDEIFTKNFFLDALQQERERNGLGKTDSKDLVSYHVSAGSKPGENYTSLIFSIDLELRNKEGTTEKEYWIIKCYPTHPGRQEFSNKTNLFHKELEVYALWIKEMERLQTEVLGLNSDQVLKLPYCRFVGGQCIDYESNEGKSRMNDMFHSLDNHIILQDLIKSFGFKLPNRREILDLAHMTLLVTALAKVHAVSWAYKNHVENDVVSKFPCLRSLYQVAPEEANVFNEIVAENMDLTMAILDQELGPGNVLTESTRNFKNNVLDSAAKFFFGGLEGSELEKFHRVKIDASKFGPNVDTKENWRIVAHGDVWSNNMLFRYCKTDEKKPVEVILVDLQLAQEACVVNDLEYVLHLCTDTAFRNSHMADLLKLYHDKFVEFCKTLKTPTLPGFSLDSLKYRFHRGRIMGFYMTVMGLPIMLKDVVVDLETESKDMNIQGLLKNVIGSAEGNSLLRRRLVESAQELYDAGVI